MSNNKNNLIVISSPSGGGKDAVIAKLIEIFPKSARLVTTTTRAPRPGDVEGVNYNFVSVEQFEEKIKNNELVEHNNYNGNYYGIDKGVLKETLEKNNIVFTNIDVNGKSSLDKEGIKHLAIFLLPENLEVLKNRIKARGGVSDADLKKRLKTAEKEIKMSDKYDHQVVNKEGEMEEAVEEIEGIIREAKVKKLAVNIAEAREDVKKGRVYNFKEIRKELGL